MELKQFELLNLDKFEIHVAFNGHKRVFGKDLEVRTISLIALNNDNKEIEITEVVDYRAPGNFSFSYACNGWIDFEYDDAPYCLQLKNIYSNNEITHEACIYEAEYDSSGNWDIVENSEPIVIIGNDSIFIEEAGR